MHSKLSKLAFALLTSLLIYTYPVQAQDTESEPLIGRWDLEVTIDERIAPSWLEVYKSGRGTLVGRFVYAFGSARPIAKIHKSKNAFSFSIPPQWEEGSLDMVISGTIESEKLSGTLRYTDGSIQHWTGERAPELTYKSDITWGTPIALFDGSDLNAWYTEGENQWKIIDGVMVNPQAGNNLITKEKFDDFKLEVTFRYPEGSNSGIYLRGRYEVQIEDNHGKEPSSTLFGGVYGFLTPNILAAKPAGEWQTYEITLIGRRVSIIANGHHIITDQNIPGITGGALDSREGEPGPIFLQGDHGPVEFKSITLTPAK